MADEKKKNPSLTNPDQAAEAEEAAKKAREEAVKEQDNPPQPYPTQEQLDEQKKSGGPIDEDGDGDVDDDDAEAKRKKAEAKAEAVRAEAEKAEQKRSLEAGKPAGYQTR